MTTTRDALTQRIRSLNEHIQRLQAKLLARKSERAELIAERDTLTDLEAAKIDALQQHGVVRVED